jgi:hypothetical protein
MLFRPRALPDFMPRFRYHSRERGANPVFERDRTKRGAKHEALFVRLGIEIA